MSTKPSVKPSEYSGSHYFINYYVPSRKCVVLGAMAFVMCQMMTLEQSCNGKRDSVQQRRTPGTICDSRLWKPTSSSTALYCEVYMGYEISQSCWRSVQGSSSAEECDRSLFK
ncbi:unnamed protein product [Caretta caretta]